MARFNTRRRNPRQTVNYEGAKAYQLSPKLNLYTQVCCASLQPKFYEPDVEAQLEKLRNTLKQVDPEFVLKLAVYAREKMHLRSVPLVLLVELAKTGYRGSLLRKATTRVIQRADEITELLSYYALANQQNWIEQNGSTKKLRKLANAIKKGIRDAFYKFDEYQFAKYNKKNAEIRLRDALFLTHPKPRNEKEAQLFKKIANDELSTPYTWETQMSEVGQQKFETEEEKQKAFKERWEKLILSRRIGIMALVKNLRNLLKYQVSEEVLKEVIGILQDEERIRKSKMFPFRFYTAYKEVSNYCSNDFHYLPKLIQELLRALEDAALTLIDSVDILRNGKILIACDVSGSMWERIAPKSIILYKDIGLVLGALAAKRLGAYVWLFDNKLENLTSELLKYDKVFPVVEKIDGGGGTYGYLIPQKLCEEKIAVDKVLIFTDMQMWGDEDFDYWWKKYKQEVNPEAKLYIFDLAGYGTSPIDEVEKDVWFIAGWSEEIFKVLSAIEKGSDAIKEIEKIRI